MTSTKDAVIDPRAKWKTLSQAERDAAYDNNGAVANSAALITARNEASAKFRAAHVKALDIPYGDRERTKVDLYPAASDAAPCLVFVHGGYWQRNSREVFAMLVEGLAAHGWSVAIPGYSLAPEATLTQIVEEVSSFLDWLAAERPSHGIAGPAGLPALTWSHLRFIIRSLPPASPSPGCTISRLSATRRSTSR